MNVFTPHDEPQNSIRFDKSNPLWAKLDAGRGHVTVEICYCSNARRMLDSARRRDDTRHDNRNASLPDCV
jgi:hypothetical protein